MPEKIDILGVGVDKTDLLSTIDAIDRWINIREKVYICVAPVSTIVDCQNDKEYKNIINNADMVTPDGMPLVWIGRLRGEKDIRRTYGPDLMLSVCEKGQQKNYKHYIYGGSDQTNKLVVKKLKEKFPRINITGNYSPPIRGKGELETSDILQKINDADPDILWVGLGSPKQDYWMYQHRDKLNVPVMVGVGAAFDFISGVKKQAPKWMQRSGLEWFFRLSSEPKRLWKRYLVGNAKFIYYILKSYLAKNIT